MREMKQKNFNLVAGIIIFLAGTLHFARAVLGWEFSVNSWDVPMFASWIAIIVGWYVGLNGLRLSK